MFLSPVVPTGRKRSLVIVTDCGHLSTMEKPEAVNAAMLEHFASPWNCVYSAAKLKDDPDWIGQVRKRGAIPSIGPAETTSAGRRTRGLVGTG